MKIYLITTRITPNKRENQGQRHGTVGKTIAYHGSQQDDIKLNGGLFYATSDKDLAKEFALGYNFGGYLLPEDKPTIYEVELLINNPMIISTEDEYDELMDISSLDYVKEELISQGIDGVIYNNNRLIYYVVLNARNQVKILNKETV